MQADGRADGRGGLSARTVRYVYTILRSGLSDAVKHGRLTANPTDRSTPPSPSEARPPEMQAWTALESGRFLRWAEARDPDLAMGWRLLAATGMPRGEALALRWRDVNLDACRLRVRRSLGVVKTKGDGEQLVEGSTKTGQARVVDIDVDTVAALRAYRATRGLLSAELMRDAALVLATLDGTHRHAERYFRRFVEQVVQARKALGEDQLPKIRLHDYGTPTRRCCWPRRAGEGGRGAPRSRQRHDHPDCPPARPSRHGPAGRRPLRRPAEGLTGPAKYHGGITRPFWP